MDTSYRLNLDLEINSEDMQSLQDAFCKSNDMYVMCIGKTHGQITSFSGNKPEEDFVDREFPSELRREIMDSFVDGTAENIVERFGKEDYFMYRGVAIRGTNGEFLGVWLCFGINKDLVPEELQMPQAIRLTTLEAFDKSILLIETLTKYYFAEKIKTQALKNQLNRERDAEHDIKYKLKKNEIMTDILRFMESENSFSKISEDILRDAGKYLECTNSALLQISENDTSVDMILEWCSNEEGALKDKFQQIPRMDLPFMNGKPYTISSDATLPEAFEIFFIKYGIKAAIFLPININDAAAMYLCFFVMENDRKWSVDDLRFANDIKRILQTVLVKKITTNSLASSYKALEVILKNAGYGVVVADINEKHVLYKNDTFNQMFDNEIDKTAIKELVFDENYVKPELNGYFAKGSGKWFDISINSINWVDGRTVRMITFYDTTDLRLYQKKVEQQAKVDSLTGLFNRQTCEKDISLEYHISKKLGERFALLMIDLDDFANVNSGMGYKVGDELLEYVAHSINDISQINGKCYRVGGDEFVVIVTHDNMSHFDYIIKRITNLFANPWTLEGVEYNCSMSMGCVKVDEGFDEAADIFTCLNIAVHSAKNNGKNRLEYYDDKSKAIKEEKAKLEQSLREAVSDNCSQFEVYYQPIMEFVNGIPLCHGAEALVRWNSKEYGLVTPEGFISEAENLRLMDSIGSFVISEAIKSCKHWNDFGFPEYGVGINLSLYQLSQKDILETIKALIKKADINPANITFEVTEPVSTEDVSWMVKILTAIRELGCKIALDDYGKAGSSLMNIRVMPIDIIKIDKSLTADMDTDKYSAAFIKAISELAKSVDLTVCASGVEVEKQVEEITQFSVNLAQGYYFDRPLSKAEFEDKYL